MKELEKLRGLYEQFDNESLVELFADYSERKGTEALMNRTALKLVILKRLKASGDTHTIDDTMKALSEYDTEEE